MTAQNPPLIVPPLIDNETFQLRDAVKEFAKYSTEVKIATDAGASGVSLFSLDAMDGARWAAFHKARAAVQG